MAAEALPMTKRVDIINKEAFAAAVSNEDKTTFVVYIKAIAKSTIMPIYPSGQSEVALLTSEEKGISAEYSDFSDIFSLDSAVELLVHTGINNHSINLLDDK